MLCSLLGLQVLCICLGEAVGNRWSMTFKKAEQNGGPPSNRVGSGGRSPSDDTPLLLPVANSLAIHHGLSSVKKTFCNIVISIVGAGVLGMPYTFKQSGWLCGSLALAFIGLASYHNMMLLVTSKRKCENDGDDHVQSYSDLGYFDVCCHTPRTFVRL